MKEERLQGNLQALFVFIDYYFITLE